MLSLFDEADGGMKILFLSNLYPPHVIGGYEALCQEVVEGLAGRGHQISVLTSTFGSGGDQTERYVHRLLSLESHLHFYRIIEAWSYPNRRKRNITHLRRIIDDMKPDIIFIWGMWNLSKQLAYEAEQIMGSRVVYYLANPWPIEANMHQAFWEMSATLPLRTYLKRILGIPARLWLKTEWDKVSLGFENAPCCSESQRDQLLAAGVPLQDSPVIYEGIDLIPYIGQASQRVLKTGGKLEMIFVGILAKHKGVHTLIESLNRLSIDYKNRVHLTILGSGDPQYEELLHRLTRKYRLSEFVTFHGRIPRNELPKLLGRFSVLLLPSIWPEPLARIMQEGLAAGMVVVASATGGTVEAIDHDKNGLLFKADDPDDLTEQIKYLVDNPQRLKVLSDEGVRTAKQKFDIKVMVDELEKYLEQVRGRAL